MDATRFGSTNAFGAPSDGASVPALSSDGDVASPVAGLALCDWPDLVDGAAPLDAGNPAEELLALRIVLGRAPRERAPSPAVGDLLISDAVADAPVELWVEDRRVALGRLRTLDGRYCVQVTELCAPPPRRCSP